MFIVPTFDAGKGRGIMEGAEPSGGLHHRGVGVVVGLRPEIVQAA